MISFDDQLLLFGGLAVPSGPTQPGAELVEDSYCSDGSGWTNEQHTFCVKGVVVYNRLLQCILCSVKLELSSEPTNYI